MGASICGGGRVPTTGDLCLFHAHLSLTQANPNTSQSVTEVEDTGEIVGNIQLEEICQHVSGW